VRPLVARILHDDVLPLLRGPVAPLARGDLFTAAALLTRKAGLAAYDSGLHGLGQRYFVQALRMAHAAGHRALGAHILVSMSHQAVDLGLPGLAVELAGAARVGAGRAVPATLTAKIALMRARGFARRGSATACTGEITAALRAFETADPGGEPWWTGSISPAYVDGQIAHCTLDLGGLDAARRHAAAALDAHRPGHRRRRAMGGLLLARIHAAAGDTAQACRDGAAATALLPDLASQRTLGELRLLMAALSSARGASHVGDFLDRVRPLIAAG